MFFMCTLCSYFNIWVFHSLNYRGQLCRLSEISSRFDELKSTAKTAHANNSSIITGRNEVVANVMFLLVSVILLMGGSRRQSPGRRTPQKEAQRKEALLQKEARRRRHPPRKENPSRRRPPWEADSGIWSMSGRYASYWNAFLFIRFIIYPFLGRHLPWQTPPDRHPLGRHLPWQTPPGRHLPWETSLGQTPPGQTPLGRHLPWQTPCWGRHSPDRHPPLGTHTLGRHPSGRDNLGQTQPRADISPLGRYPAGLDTPSASVCVYVYVCVCLCMYVCVQWRIYRGHKGSPR